MSVEKITDAPLRRAEPICGLRLNSPRQANGFTIIELVGVLAIIAIIAAAIAPSVIKRIDRAAWQRETSDLDTMGNALVQYVPKFRQIPSHAGLSNAIAAYSDLAVGQVAVTPRGFGRMFLMDPALTNALGGNALPYNQGPGGLRGPPTNSAGANAARIMIISTIGRGTLSDTFQTIWNTPEGVAPTNWTGKADDLCIKRIELGSLFHRVSLMNNDTNDAGYALYQLDGLTEVGLDPRGGNTNIYVLDGTALNLYQANDLSELQLRIIVDKDLSFTYQEGRWSGDLGTGGNPAVGSFGQIVSDFLNAKPCHPGNNYVVRQDVVDQFYNYLFYYWMWSTNGYSGGPNTPQTPGYRAVTGAQTELHNFALDLIQ